MSFKRAEFIRRRSEDAAVFPEHRPSPWTGLRYREGVGKARAPGIVRVIDTEPDPVPERVTERRTGFPATRKHREDRKGPAGGVPKGNSRGR